MELLQRLQDDMKTAMKTSQKQRLGVIRMLLSDVKNVDLASKPTTPEQAIDAYARKLRKGVEEYQKLNKTDEVAKLKEELAIVEEYLPKKASPEETQKLVDAFLSQNTFTEKQIGPATGAFMKLHGGQVDPQQANAMLRKALAGK